MIETIFYGTAFGGTYLRFELYENGHVAQSYDFKDEKLLTRFEDGVAEVVNRVADARCKSSIIRPTALVRYDAT